MLRESFVYNLPAAAVKICDIHHVRNADASAAVHATYSGIGGFDKTPSMHGVTITQLQPNSNVTPHSTG